jgi:hypothetical protein
MNFGVVKQKTSIANRTKRFILSSVSAVSGQSSAAPFLAGRSGRNNTKARLIWGSMRFYKARLACGNYKQTNHLQSLLVTSGVGCGCSQ